MSGRQRVALLGLAALTAVGCGTRVDGGRALPAAQPSAQPSAPGSDGSTAAVQEVASTAPVGGLARPQAGGGATAVPPAGTAKSPQSAPARPGVAAGNVGASSSARPAAASAAGVERGPAPAPTPGPAPSLPENTGGPKSPLVVANVGSYSGPGGVTLKPIMQGAQLWVNYVNRRGGVNGHRIQFIVYDDGTDPARHRAQVQEAIEQRKAHAFLANIEGFGGNDATAAYINSKGVPVIGSEGSADYFYDFPMFFPQQSHGAGFFYGALAALGKQAVAQSKTKIGVITCAEAQRCADAGNIWTRYAPENGLQVVYQARISIAQPEFSAVCLAARNSGVQSVVFVADSNTLGRFSTSCARQGYRPLYAVPSAISEARQASDPNLVGMVANTSLFPYFQRNTPATAEYHEALTLVGGKGFPVGNGPPMGWVAGKLLQKGAAQLPEPPTSDAIVRGLRTLQNDTLGGLTLPLTFSADVLPVRNACWFTIVVDGGEWVSPNGFQLECRKEPLPKGW